MNRLEIYGIQSTKIIEYGDEVYPILKNSIEANAFQLKTNDILIITSKVVSLEKKLMIKLEDIIPSQQASELGQKANMNPKVVQVILDEPKTEVIGNVQNALLTINTFGMIPNAGVARLPWAPRSTTTR